MVTPVSHPVIVETNEMIEQKRHRCDSNDPRRCQSNIKGDQCPWLSEPGSSFCQTHSNDHKNFDSQLRNYRLAKWQARVSQFSENEYVKSLREEIGILRMVLEEILTRCQDSTDLMMYSSKISDYILKIEKLVTSCHRLEERTNILLDKSSIIHLAGVMVEIVGRFVNDSIVMDKITEEILENIKDMKLKE